MPFGSEASGEAYLFTGGEITKKMELGMITKGLGNGILAFGRSINPMLHHSFGREDANALELPHIVAPLWSSVDRIIVTDPSAGEASPVLGTILEEDEGLREKRKKNDPGVCKVSVVSTKSLPMGEDGDAGGAGRLFKVKAVLL